MRASSNAIWLGEIMVSGLITCRRHNSSTTPMTPAINATRVKTMPLARVITPVVPSP